jgi:hypothetical protein
MLVKFTVEFWLTPGSDIKCTHRRQRRHTVDTAIVIPCCNSSSFGLSTEPTCTNMAPSTSNNTTGLTALAAAASSSTTSGRNMADDDASIDVLLGINDHHGAPEVQEVAPTKDPIEEATLDDVEFIDEDANEPQLPVGIIMCNASQANTLSRNTSIILSVDCSDIPYIVAMLAVILSARNLNPVET